MNWINKVEKNICPQSLEKYDVVKALKEWEYHDDTYDLGQAVEDCELCDHPNIRYQFEIVNIHNGNVMLIGSECIIKFQIGVTDEFGKRLEDKDAVKKVNRDKNRLIVEAREKSVIHSLIKLAAIESTIQIDKFISYYRERKAFTPNQLSLLVWKFEVFRVEFTISHFKTTIKRNREKEQLLNMDKSKLNKIWDCLSKSQKDFYLENKKK